MRRRCNLVFENQFEAREWQPDFAALTRSANRVTGWAAKLHVLQIIAKAQPTAEELDPNDLSRLARDCIASERPMLRAWGYAALDILGREFPELRDDAIAVLNHARETETAGSVQARLRKCHL